MRVRILTRESAYLELAGLAPAEACLRPLAALEVACAAVLELGGDEVPWYVRMRVADLARALVDPRDPPAPIPGAEPTPTTRPSHRSANRAALRAFHGDWRRIAEAAIDAGFEVRRTSSGHALFTAPPPSTATFGIPTGHGDASSSHGRALENGIAQARRAGVPI